MNYPSSYPFPHDARLAASRPRPRPLRRPPGPLRADRQIRAFRIAMWVFCAIAVGVALLAALAV
ncbi:MAG: hypothetical protein H6713_25655 [Myxococcales bacterium]|nr:hypothetical protein [Myxococcales bacterium]